VIAYALLENRGRSATGMSRVKSLPPAGAGMTILNGVAAVLAIVCGLTLVATANQELLAALILNGRFTHANTVVVTSLWMVSLLALIALWWQRPRRVLDLWLMVVMCAWTTAARPATSA
jgi:hypothetical protein